MGCGYRHTTSPVYDRAVLPRWPLQDFRRNPAGVPQPPSVIVAAEPENPKGAQMFKALVRGSRLMVIPVAAVAIVVPAVAATPERADAASGAYGTATSCRLSSSQSVTIQPHFQISGGNRRLDGYAFTTSGADTIAVIGEYAYLGGDDSPSGVLGSVVTQPNASKGTRLDLVSYFKSAPAGVARVDFTVKDASGRSCSTPTVAF